MSAISKYSNYAQFKNVDSKVNAMIAFDKSGTPNQIIGSDGTNGLIWVDSDPSSASYWSEYPATQTVDIADQNIENVDTIELVNIIDSSGSSGTDTQLLSQDAVGAKWIDQSDVIEKWSQYPATQTIDASGNDISDVNNLIANKIKIGELSYQSAFPIGIEVAFDENTFTTGIIAQNKDSANTSSVSILLTNDIGTDSTYYGGLTMFSSNTVPTYGFPSIKNAISLNSQSSSVVISPWNGQQDGTADENGNIMLTYSGGSKAHIINNNGQLIVGANNPSYSGSAYGGDNGGTDNVLTSNGTNGLKWITPEYAPLWSEFPATQTIDASGNDISGVDAFTATGSVLVDKSTPGITQTANLSNNLTITTGTTNSILNAVSLRGTNSRTLLELEAPNNGLFVSNIAGNLRASVRSETIEIQDFSNNLRAGMTYERFFVFNQNLNSNTNLYPGLLQQGNSSNVSNLSITELQINDRAGVDISTLNRSSLNITNSTNSNTSILTANNLTFNGIPGVDISTLNRSSLNITNSTNSNTSILTANNLTFNGIPYNRNMINSTLVYSSAALYISYKKSDNRLKFESR